MRDWLWTMFKYTSVAIFAVVAIYTVLEWWYWSKSGLHDLRPAAIMGKADALMEMGHDLRVEVDAADSRVRQALAAQVDMIERTFLEYRAVMERRIQDDERQIANLQRQIQALKAQRTPVEQVAASGQVRWVNRIKSTAAVPSAPSRSDLAALARAAGFTFVQVRP